MVDAGAETATARTLVLDIPGWDSHRAGQHVDVRLTAEDGYQASRSYSLSSGPNEAPQITVERVDDGEVSPYLVDFVEIGDSFEVLGPLGGYFVWEPTDQHLLVVGGGSGIAPLRSMWRAGTTGAPITVLYSARTADRIIFGHELNTNQELTVKIHLTREEDPTFATGRIDGTALGAVLDGHDSPASFICGPTAFVDTIAEALLGLGVDRDLIRTERFG